MQLNQVLFLAPGGGLGHIVRSVAIAMELKQIGNITPLILSSSPYSNGLARLSGIKISRVPLKFWAQEVLKTLNQINPQLLVCDTFPFGIQGELQEQTNWLKKSVYIARHLKYENYFVTNGFSKPNLAAMTIAIEPLQERHVEWVASGESELFTTDYPIRFPAENFPAPVSQKIYEPFKSKPVDLIVHSGPVQELEMLAAYTTKEQSLIVSPRPILQGYDWLEYFPAAHLYKYANKIITGAGYNAMAELAGYKDKHIAVPFERNYDDQQLRTTFSIPDGNSNKQVAHKIGSLLN